MSNKFLTLARLSGDLPVPPLMGIDDAALRTLWLNFDEVAQAAASVLADIKLTAGAFLDEHLGRLPTQAHIVWAPQAGATLQALLTPAGLTVDEPLAVRSSADVEDGEQQSFAGIFSSHLGVQGWAALQRAIVDVWLSAFSRSAVMERLRLGNALQDVGMTVIVQRMVAARWAGVAFSHDPMTGAPQPVLEAVPGLADCLVAGTQRPVSARLAGESVQCDAELQPHEAMVREVAALARRVSGLLGAPADIEWVADSAQVWLVQARQVTTLQAAREQTGPLLEWTDLYLADDDVVAPFRPLPGFAQYFRSKRSPLARFAVRHGVAAGRALLIRANRAGLAQAEHAAVLDATMAGDRVVLDLSDEVRQQIVPRDIWLSRVAEFSSEAASVVVVREFIAGEAGLISQLLPDGRVICEHSTEGLLAINRGTAGTRSMLLGGGPPHPDAPIGAEQQAAMLAITRQAQQEFGSIQLEWVTQQGQLRLIDFSPVRAALGAATEGALRTISPGYAEGDCVSVAADRGLHEVSVSARVSIDEIPDGESLGPAIAELVSRLKGLAHKPVVASPRPYAALAAVLPYVKGFVFEQASMLCHLSILLREHGVPAVESPELYRDALAGQRIAFSASV